MQIFMLDQTVTDKCCRKALVHKMKGRNELGDFKLDAWLNVGFMKQL